jgi:hypothetical protein
MKNENNPMQRNTANYKFMLSPRCGAKTRQGTACKSPSVRDKSRCRMHGGKSKGAPLHNQYALKHGFNTKEIRTMKKIIKIHLKNLIGPDEG